MNRNKELLQAITDACGGAQFASIESIKTMIHNLPRKKVINLLDLNDNVIDIEPLLKSLEKRFLIERRNIKGILHVGLTEEGQRRSQ